MITRLTFATIIGFIFLQLNSAHADWPCFQGPKRDGLLSVKDAKSFKFDKKPKLLWKKEIGSGYSSPVADAKNVFLFHRKGDKAILTKYQMATGEIQWEKSYPSVYSDSFSSDHGPRATPAIGKEHVFTFGAEGILQAWNLKNGEKAWSVDTPNEFQVGESFFGAGCSPLIYKDKVILIVGGKKKDSGVVAFDVKSGKVVWGASSHEASYSSPIIKKVGDKDRLFCFTRKGLLILNPEDGKVEADFYWRPRIHASVNAATPLVFDDKVFISTSYGKGSVVLSIKNSPLKTVWEERDALTSHYATAVHHNGVFYGHHGRQDYPPGPSFRGVRSKDGRVLWDKRALGAGNVSLAGDHLVLFQETGEVLILKADPLKFSVVSKHSLFEGAVRSYPAFGKGLFIGRDDKTIKVWDWKLGK